MVARDILLAELTGAHVHIAHLSTAGAVRLVRDAKARGVRVTAEVTPHHLRAHRRGRAGVRHQHQDEPAAADQARRRGAARGAGRRHDRLHRHRPRAARGSARRRASSTSAAFGIVGLETAVAVLLDRLVRPGHLPLRDAGRAAEPRPGAAARPAGRQPGAGRAGGRDDARSRGAEWTVDPARFQSKSRNTPFGGWTLHGRPVDDDRGRHAS